MTSGRTDKPETAQVAGLGENKISGVFSTQNVVKVGTGTTQRKTIQKTYWYCMERDDEGVDVQPLNKSFIPSGPKRNVPKDEFLEKFSPEPEFYIQTVYPAMQELDDTIVRGEQHRARGAQYSAEFEFKQATNLDEDNVRANFGLGLTYLDRGDQVKANDIFKRLVKLDAAFETEHKHLFNDFGINLRKNRMYDQALDYYLRAENLAENTDEHLYHNIARVFYEQGELKQCIEYLKKSLELNPKLEESKKFWEFLDKNGMLDGKPKPGGGSKKKVQIDL
ncbi:tetratricopeptide repeat protein [Desulfovibrio oxyclinae]|jgi:tetratricopeptide (TPR) repeat protein|uniref:tetratricopeptide repeat protein n=1 Tax=Desulfovibrio oxyclinae TaxID=63560 RepID=UPI00037EAE21|nr:tetratricopeptide repeat protein [Desulfovibrio oxyclinae]